MMQNVIQTNIINKIPIRSVLEQLGYRSIANSGGEAMYRNFKIEPMSPKYQLKVNEHLNMWYDQTAGEGGTVIDFGRKCWPELSEEIIERRLHDMYVTSVTHCNREMEDRPRRKRKPMKIPFYQLSHTRCVGHNAQITDYLKENGLWEIADGNIREIHYFVMDQKGFRKDFCGAGWQNENGGWEVRSKNFIGRIGPRGMTNIDRSQESLLVFPDYMDYLLRRNDPQAYYSSILILNSADLLPAAIGRSARFPRVRFSIKPEHMDSLRVQICSRLPNAEVVVL
ncbi:hypothetical protein [Sphingobacterium suaedae]|uniref:DNA primase n=1 Tax=Sphingobacterium suaedae TaxID=1686402 RepID=A0ABW5KLN5_9SPHI